MATKKKLIKVVPYSEIVGTSWNLSATVCCSLNELLHVLHLPFSKVDVSRYIDNCRYNLYLKVDGMPAFTIYDVRFLQYGVEPFDEYELNKIIHWQIGTFSVELSYKVCKYLSSLGLNVFKFDNT